jgi:hypothetical protein
MQHIFSLAIKVFYRLIRVLNGKAAEVALPGHGKHLFLKNQPPCSSRHLHTAPLFISSLWPGGSWRLSNVNLIAGIVLFASPVQQMRRPSMWSYGVYISHHFIILIIVVNNTMAKSRGKSNGAFAMGRKSSKQMKPSRTDLLYNLAFFPFLFISTPFIIHAS